MMAIDLDTLTRITGGVTAEERSAAFKSGFDNSIAWRKTYCSIPRFTDWIGMTHRYGAWCMRGAAGDALKAGHAAVEALEGQPNQ